MNNEADIDTEWFTWIRHGEFSSRIQELNSMDFPSVDRLHSLHLSVYDELCQILKCFSLGANRRLVQRGQGAFHSLARLIHSLLNGGPLPYSVYKPFYAFGVLPAAIRERHHIFVTWMRFSKIDGWQGDQSVEEIRSYRLANCGRIPCEIKDIVHDLKGHANLITKCLH